MTHTSIQLSIPDIYLFLFISIFIHLYLDLVAGGKTIQNRTSSSLTHKIQKCTDIKEGVFLYKKEKKKRRKKKRKEKYP